MSAFFRRRVEETIEHLIAVLDEMDGDCDLEAEPAEEQHDREFDPSEDGIADKLALRAVIAEYENHSAARPVNTVGRHGFNPAGYRLAPSMLMVDGSFLTLLD